ncbi:hypothetical protein MBLNU457_5153t1 [Dothideomycetes sp. NU457]
MADFDDDYDDAYYLDDDYVYVDDSFDLADELAENSIPEPPLIERKEEDWDDFDSYDYWMDIEYNTDEYYDTLLQHNGQALKIHAGKKRKVESNTGGPVPASKRRKVSTVQGKEIESNGLHEITPVIWLPFEKTHTLCDMSQPYTVSSPYTLFKDWREVFKTSTGFSTAPKTGRKSKLAAQASERRDVEVMNEDMSGIEDEGDEGFEDDEEDDEVEGGEHDEERDMEDEYEEADEQDEEGLGLDPEQLMSVLQQKLSGSGMGAAQQANMMKMIMSSISKGGRGGLEDLLGELTESILDQATQEGSDLGAAQWLSQQGIAFHAEEDQEDDEAQTAEANDMNSATPSGDALPGPSTSGSDSKVPTSHDDITNADKQVLEELEAAEKPAAISSKESKDQKVKAKQTTKAAPRHVQRSKATVAAPRTTRSKPGPASTVVEKPATRKRKVDTDEAAEPDTKPKRQARNFAAPTASSANKNKDPEKKTTRTTRQSKK